MEEPEALVRRYADMVYRLAYAQTHSRADADDIFQEVFLRYFRKPHSFASEEHRKAWLLRVTVNCSNSLFSSLWRKRTEPLNEEADYISFSQPEEQPVALAMDQLKPKYRTVLHLFYFEGYSTEEIGQILGRRPSTVRSQLTRGREQLAHLLKGDDFDEI